MLKIIKEYSETKLFEALQPYLDYGYSVLGFTIVIHPTSVSCNREYVVLINGYKDLSKKYCSCGTIIKKNQDRCISCAQGG